jgi:small subunit ribosomal protein S17
MANRFMKGKVIRDSNDKTIVVQVEVMKMHPKYGKRIRLHKKFHVHDENNQYKSGDLVSFVSSRPISKLKKWTVFSEGGSK